VVEKDLGCVQDALGVFEKVCVSVCSLSLLRKHIRLAGACQYLCDEQRALLLYRLSMLIEDSKKCLYERMS